MDLTSTLPRPETFLLESHPCLVSWCAYKGEKTHVATTVTIISLPGYPFSRMTQLFFFRFVARTPLLF